jgi:hypothetical protein
MTDFRSATSQLKSLPSFKRQETAFGTVAIRARFAHNLTLQIKDNLCDVVGRIFRSFFNGGELEGLRPLQRVVRIALNRVEENCVGTSLAP